MVCMMQWQMAQPWWKEVVLSWMVYIFLQPGSFDYAHMDMRPTCSPPIDGLSGSLVDTVAAQFPCPCASLNSSATSYRKTQSDPTLGLPTQDSCAWPYAEPWETKQSFLSVDWLDDPPLPEHVGGVEPVRNPAHGVVLARRSMSFPIAPLKNRSADTEGKKTAAPFV